MTVDVNDIQVLFCDLQHVIVANSKTVSPEAISSAAGALARAAKILGWPVTFLTVPESEGENTLLPILRAHADEKNTFTRRVTDPFLVPAFVDALSANRRNTVVISGVSTEVAVLQTSFGALAAGYKVYVPVDAIGSRSERTEAAALREIEHAGAVSTSVRSLLLRLTPDLSKDLGREILETLGSL